MQSLQLYDINNITCMYAVKTLHGKQVQWQNCRLRNHVNWNTSEQLTVLYILKYRTAATAYLYNVCIV